MGKHQFQETSFSIFQTILKKHGRQLAIGKAHHAGLTLDEAKKQNSVYNTFSHYQGFVDHLISNVEDLDNWHNRNIGVIWQKLENGE